MEFSVHRVSEVRMERNAFDDRKPAFHTLVIKIYSEEGEAEITLYSAKPLEIKGE